MIRKIADELFQTMDRKRLLRFCLVFGMLIGLLAHGFMFANKLPNHDDLNHYMDLNANGVNCGIGSGRYFLFFFWKLFSDLSTPWLNGMLGVFFMSWAAFFLCDALGLRQRWQVIAATLVMQLYPSSCSIYTYMYEAHVLMLGIMLACMAPWLMRHGGRLRLAWAACAVWVATGIYQTEVMLAIGFLMLYLICRCAEGLRGPAAWAEALKCAGVAIAGLVLYLVGVKLSTAMLGVELNAYQGMNEMGSLSVALIPEKIRQAYQTFWNTYVADVPAYVNGRMMLVRLPLFAGGLGGVAWLAARALRRKDGWQAALLIACGLLLPLVCCGIYFMGDHIELHNIAFYPMLLPLLVPLAVIRPTQPTDKLARRALALVAAALYAGYGLNAVIFDNQLYLRHYQGFTRVEHMAQRLAGRIERLEGYEPGLPVRIWGYVPDPNPLLYTNEYLDERFHDFAGIAQGTMDAKYLFWEYCTSNMLRQVVGLSVTDGSEWQPKTAEEEALVAAMPIYPAKGSVAMVGGVCVVKISE